LKDLERDLWPLYAKRIKIESLYKLGIYHGDIGEENIVVDFGRSKFIKDITNDNLKQNIFATESADVEDYLARKNRFPYHFDRLV